MDPLGWALKSIVAKVLFAGEILISYPLYFESPTGVKLVDIQILSPIWWDFDWFASKH